MSDLLKNIEVPTNVQYDPLMCPSQLKIYNDRVECVGGQGQMFFFKDYTGVSIQTASLFCGFASVRFLNSVNAGTLPQNGIRMLADKNRINFCSGVYSYKAANEFVVKAYAEIKDAFEQYKKSTPDTASVNSTNDFSEADEIFKFKKLLDEGIITQEEFDAKKKQLLGL